MQLSVAELQEAMGALGVRAEGFFERAVPMRHSATILSAIGSRRGGRYNPAGAFDAYYLGKTATTVALDTRMIVNDENGKPIAAPHPPTALLPIDYHVQCVVNVNKPAPLARMGITQSDLLTEWKNAVEIGAIPITQRIDLAALANRTEALFVPSARSVGDTNLVIIRPNLRKGSFIAVRDAAGAFPPGTVTRIDGNA